MDTVKLNRIVAEKIECVMQNRPEGCSTEYYTMFEDEGELFYLTDSGRNYGYETIEHQGMYISKMPFDVFADVMGSWQYLVMNSKAYRAGVTEREIKRYDFGWNYLAQLCGRKDVGNFIQERTARLHAIYKEKVRYETATTKTKSDIKYWYSKMSDGRIYLISTDDEQYGTPGVELFQYHWVYVQEVTPERFAQLKADMTEEYKDEELLPLDVEELSFSGSVFTSSSFADDNDGLPF